MTDKINVSDVCSWLTTAITDDVNEVAEAARVAQEKKKDEERETLLRVTADGLWIGWWKRGQITDVLEYLLKHAGKNIGESAQIENVRVRKSEVSARLAEARWYD